MVSNSLQPLFCTPLTNIMADLALFLEVLDFDWENRKFFALDTQPPALIAIQRRMGLSEE
jgi:hypothetical protein